MVSIKHEKFSSSLSSRSHCFLVTTGNKTCKVYLRIVVTIPVLFYRGGSIDLAWTRTHARSRKINSISLACLTKKNIFTNVPKMRRLGEKGWNGRRDELCVYVRVRVCVDRSCYRLRVQCSTAIRFECHHKDETATVHAYMRWP
jgi:hypothetical protein